MSDSLHPMRDIIASLAAASSGKPQHTAFALTRTVGALNAALKATPKEMLSEAIARGLLSFQYQAGAAIILREALHIVENSK